MNLRFFFVVSAVCAVLVGATGCGGDAQPKARFDTTASAQPQTSASPESVSLPLTCEELQNHFPDGVYESPALTGADKRDNDAFRSCLFEGTEPTYGWRSEMGLVYQRAMKRPKEGYERWGEDEVADARREGCGGEESVEPLPGHSSTRTCYSAIVTADGERMSTFDVSTARHHTFVTVWMTVYYETESQDTMVREYQTASVKQVIDVILSDGRSNTD